MAPWSWMAACVTASASSDAFALAAIGMIMGGDRKHQGAPGLRSNVHVHRLVLERLKAADGPSELLAQAQIVERDVLRLFHDAKQFAGVREQGEIVECVNGVARRRMR